MMNTNECQGTNRTGGPCSAMPQTDKFWCVWHDPDLTEQRQRWIRDSGKAKSNKRRARKKMAEAVMSIDDIDALLCAAMQQVGAGTMEPGIGNAMASIAGRIVSIRTASDLEARLASLEARAGLRPRSWSG